MPPQTTRYLKQSIVTLLLPGHNMQHPKIKRESTPCPPITSIRTTPLTLTHLSAKGWTVDGVTSHLEMKTMTIEFVIISVTPINMPISKVLNRATGACRMG